MKLVVSLVAALAATSAFANEPAATPASKGDPKAAETIVNQVCAGCHSGPGFSGSVQHAPANDACLTCHRPHGGEVAALLTQPRNQLCGACHDAKDGFAAAHAGFPVAQAECSGCHAPHSAASA